MSPLNWTISMDLFSLLYGERPKLNQHWVLGKKTSRRRRPWLRSETGKNKIYRSKTVQTVSAEGHPKSAEELRLSDFFKKNYTAIGNDDQTDQTLLVSLRYAKSNKFSGLSYYNSHLIGHNSFLKREIIYRPVVSEPTDRYNHGKYMSMIKL